MPGQFLVAMKASRVLIVKSNLETFRVPFYSGLESQLGKKGVELRVAVPRARCRDFGFSWLQPVRGVQLSLAGKTLSWQSVGKCLGGVDLVIVQQCAREVTNYHLLALRRAFGYKLALWGHGAEFQRSWSTPLTGLIKSRVFSRVDYWFAYTPLVATVVERSGYPSERICTVFNSIDVRAERERHQVVTDEQVQALRAELRIEPRARLICYCGSLNSAKRLDVLLAACTMVRDGGMDLHIAILGDGPERRRLERAATELPWCHVLGITQGDRKAIILRASECMAIPSAVGLAVVDAFAHECPLVTMANSGHGPEIEYMLHQVNGLKTPATARGYADGLTMLLTENDLRERLKRGCREAASRLGIEKMVEHFASGVLSALALPRYGRLGRSSPCPGRSEEPAA